MSVVARALKVGAYDDFWASPPEGYLGPNLGGTPIGGGSAWKIGTVWRCINVIGGTFGSTPLILYRRRPPPSKGRDRATDRVEYRLLRLEPAPRFSAYRYRSVAMNHLLTWGNHFAEKIFDGSLQLRQLVGLRPDRMQVRWADDGGRIYLYRDRYATEQRLPDWKVFHVPGMGFDGLVGYAPLTLMRETVASYVAARDFGAAFFRNGARPAVIMTHPKTMSPGAIERLTAQMDKLRGAPNAGKTLLLEEGGDFKELGIQPEDAQYMESQRFYGVSSIATWFGVPPHMVGDVDRSTSWGSGIEEQKDGFISFTMLSWFTSWEQETAVQLLPSDVDDLYAEFMLDNLLRGKTLDRAQAYQILRNIGALSANEIRDRENLNPREDAGGDEYWLPLNMGSEGVETDAPNSSDPNSPLQLRTLAVPDPRTRRNGAHPEVTV